MSPAAGPALGRYRFVSWVRRGIGASLTDADTFGVVPSRPKLSVAVTLSADGAAQPPVTKDVFVFGPGDIIGFDPRHVVRTEPRNFTANFEPNYLAGIDFDHADLPWMFTPAGPAADRLRPWVALIVLKDTAAPGPPPSVPEFTEPKVAPNPLPVIDVIVKEALQDLTDSWNWAHVQISGYDDVQTAVATDPSALVSRVLCPRRLDPETSYTAFLVPAFEVGRKAGLGNDVSGDATTDAAWTHATVFPLRLPVYYRFSFRTSDAGDFESLVRRLTPRNLPAEVGIRPMDVSDPAPHFPSAGGPLGLEGALRSIHTQTTPWPAADRDRFQTALEPLLNLTTPTVVDLANPGADPKIVPPIYGRWHAGTPRVDRTKAGWLNELNLDPRNRSGGGMGTQVVLKERAQLLASAWKQVEGVIRANQLLRQAQLARAAMLRLFAQHFVAAPHVTMLTLTAPVHAQVLASPRTVAATMAATRLPVRAFSGAFRRITSPRGAVRRRQNLGTYAPDTLVRRINDGTVELVPPLKPPGGLRTIDDVAATLEPPWAAFVRRWLSCAVIALIVLLLAVLVVVAAVAGVVAMSAVLVAVAVAAGLAYPRIQNALAAHDAAGVITLGQLTPSGIATIGPRPNFTVVPPKTPPATGPGGASDSAEAARFREALLGLSPIVVDHPVEPPPRPPADVAVLRGALVARLNPSLTVVTRTRSLVAISATLWNPPDPLEPIMAAPEFPQPMYAPLRDLSKQYLLPGVELIPPDTVGLLVTNHAFIETYMVGLNHEMARQLLWCAYPTDQRGSYFRQFWDVSRAVPPPSTPEQIEHLRDIPKIHTWPHANALGQNENRHDINPDSIVLLVRGELLKRYPTTQIYAIPAVRAADGSRVPQPNDWLAGDRKNPLFGGFLDPDLNFFGFDLTPDQARGTGTGADLGWFFVFQQPPTEPRFGLEPNDAVNPVPHWSELAWTDFGDAGVFVPSAPAVVEPLAARARTAASADQPLSFGFNYTTTRLASSLFRSVLEVTNPPDFLRAGKAPVGLAIVNDPDNPQDADNVWGKDSAQTAYITFRVPWRVMIHADMMV